MPPQTHRYVRKWNLDSNQQIWKHLTLSNGNRFQGNCYDENNSWRTELNELFGCGTKRMYNDRTTKKSSIPAAWTIDRNRWEDIRQLIEDCLPCEILSSHLTLKCLISKLSSLKCNLVHYKKEKAQIITRIFDSSSKFSQGAMKIVGLVKSKTLSLEIS